MPWHPGTHNDYKGRYWLL